MKNLSFNLIFLSFFLSVFCLSCTKQADLGFGEEKPTPLKEVQLPLDPPDEKRDINPCRWSELFFYAQIPFQIYRRFG